MQLGYVVLGESGAVDQLFADLAKDLAAAGIYVAGVVQERHNRHDRSRCDLRLRQLPQGPVTAISLDLGEGSEGCRLDTGALEQISAEVAANLPLAKLVLINRYGKQEARGKGFVTVLAEALGIGVPVLVGVAPGWVAEFQSFSAGMAKEVLPEPKALKDWALSAVRIGATV